jgi:hypothetical protein
MPKRKVHGADPTKADTSIVSPGPGPQPPPVPSSGSVDGGVVPPVRVDVLKEWADESSDALSLVRLDNNETIIILFTSDGHRVRLHYLGDTEFEGYVQCNGEGCLLCRIGRSQDERDLLPVYVPVSRSIGVLAISTSSRPGALRPQLLPILRSPRRMAVTIRRKDRVKYEVNTVELRPDVDDGGDLIAEYERRWDADQVDLTVVYPRRENRDLAEFSSVAAMMKVKGIAL